MPQVQVRSRVGDAFKRFWVVLVIAAVIAVATFAVFRLRTFFGTQDNHSVVGGGLDDIKPFKPKHVVYQVWGAPGATANINYMDVDFSMNAHPLKRKDNVPLPWTLSVETTVPSVSANVIAQTEADHIACRITVSDTELPMPEGEFAGTDPVPAALEKTLQELRAAPKPTDGKPADDKPENSSEGVRAETFCIVKSK